MTYPNVQPQPSFPTVEREILAFWDADGTFQASIDARDGADEYVFYDGPPFANGLPHYGHLLTGFVKDAVPRYRTMRGQQVHRRFGWDCHGLPAEVVAEKELGISGHPEIAKFGIDKFNDACRTSVLRFTDDWHRYVNRQARWVDFDNDYKTLDTSYMESVMWAFKTLWDKGLVYEGFRVLAYCWRCETPLSNTETRMDDVYRDRQDPALTVQFHLESGEIILAWTTTPWTLPSNLALAVGPEIEYAVMEETDSEGHTTRYILAEARLGSYEKELAGATRVGTLTGADLVGRKYTPLFPYFADTPNAFHVLAADFVTTEDGTGVVHMAPGFGEDDQNICNAVGIPTLCPMDEHGRYTAEVTDWAGMHVFDANPEVIKHLKARGVVVRHDSYLHSYPHCWRCAEPLVYRAISSWFVQVTAVRDRMVELNQQIRWVPEHIKDGQFGKWLANARDWAISRNRFWGSPIPVWRSDDPEYPRIDVYGSLAEMERDFGVAVTDLHRPYVDDLVRPNPDDPTGKSMMRRVPEVLDCWFESGSMPFAQVHYPFENREWFDSHYPGDFIVEYIGQTRGWFYTLHVLATALFDKPSFNTCVSHGIVLGDDGQKMSKSLQNYPDPMMVFDTYGSDAMRWYLLSSPILRGTDLMVTEDGIRDTVRHIILPIWNSWYFLSLYANAAGTSGTFRTDSTDVLDRYILAKTHDLLAEITVELDEYDLFAACGAVRSFLDALTNWYVRRSRDRFWAGDQDAIDTLHTVLALLCRALAPLLPLVTESVYQGLTGERSVHLTDYPSAADVPADPALVESMDLVRDVCSSTLRLRKAHGRRVRQPLAALQVAVPGSARLAPFTDLVADEVNVKSVTLTDDVDSVASYDLQVVPAKLGPRLGGQVQQVIKAVKSGDWQQTAGGVVAGGVALEEGEYALKLVVQGDGASTPLSAGAGIVLLDTALTPELEAEGVTRDLVRLVQQARRDAGLQVSDRISLTLGLPESVRRQVTAFQHLLTDATLATSLNWGTGETNADLDGEPIHITVAVAG
ncbi:MAG: isoleucine--tRNA ligase [Actinobacteria bacterium]|uniref:isoleucine--tRNA ligase n=1 Tax=freshwater metagenome TaxID=449393 RepID=A0A6J6A9E2_9ZZZZ|nr:isoleucine--tRNA ligase [Actinomycetota bacterium]MSW79148.1 isoleucine--tRNA ligase [Actinomycetota bacterium]MSZ83686.1 isoleucine--tRNA ligase [Actinomycetota bacterium]MTB18356.1 isoleucine--tRNA ligase [Actinomycetota bacterium]